MMVWLHTASPPQHIATVQETVFSAYGGCVGYPESTNYHRAICAKFCGVFEDPKGQTSVHIFDEVSRANAWIDRNADMDVITSSEH